MVAGSFGGPQIMLLLESIKHWPATLRAPVLRCARGELPPNVALMQMCAAAPDRKVLRTVLKQAIDAFGMSGNDAAAARLHAAQSLWTDTPQAWNTVRAVLAETGEGIAQGASDPIGFWSNVFDRICRVAPEAGVALYALGRADLLDAATEEIVQCMRERHLLGPDRIMLDVGCGIGRLLTALRHDARLVIGLDISRGMLAVARARCRALGNVALVQGSGRNFAAFRRCAFDLVYAVDSFPYLVQAGEEIAARCYAEAHRVLKPGGTFLIMNFSYRGSLGRDRDDAQRLAARSRFAIVENGVAGMHHWDGRIFHFVKDRTGPSAKHRISTRRGL